MLLSQRAKDGGSAKSVAEIAKLDAANQRIADQTDIEKTMLNSFKVMANDVLKEKIGALVTQASKDFIRRAASRGAESRRAKRCLNREK